MELSSLSRRYSSESATSERPKLKRRPSFTYEGEIPKDVSKGDIDRLPAIPRFKQGLSSQDVREGDTAYLECKVKGNPPPSVNWYRNGQSISLPTNRIWMETAGDGKIILVISGVSSQDGGNYRCSIVNKLGRDSSLAFLHVRCGDKSKVIKHSPDVNGLSSTSVEQISSKSPEVLGADSPTPKLSRSTHSFEKQAFACVDDTSSVQDTSSLRKSSIASSTSTSYPVTTDSDDFSLSSSQPLFQEANCDVMSFRTQRSPQFTIKPQSKVAEEGQTVVFESQVSGAPQPSVAWYKGASKLLSSDRHIVGSTSANSSLEIRDLRATDGGTYRCVASNSAGKASCSVELVLAAKEPPSQMPRDRPPSFSQTLRNVDVNSGERARFECKVEGRPKPTVVWNKDGKVLSASSRVRIMEVYGTHSLVMSRVDRTDNGVYSLTASNHLGSESCSGQLHVQDISTSRGSSSSHLSGYGVVGSGHSSPNASNLSSPSLSPKLGRAAAAMLVTGNSSPWNTNLKSTPGRGGGGGAPPRRRGPGFILRPRPQTIAPGESLCLKCTLLGHPKPTVTWEKNGELVDEDRTDGHIRTRIEGNDYYLEIDECGVGDAGKYAVTARNSLGKQTAAIEVTVTGSGSSVTTFAHTTKIGRSNHRPDTHSPANDNHLSRHEELNNNNRHNSSASSLTSDDERRPVRATELIIPSNFKPEDRKDSPTSSISSTISSHSRMSTSSSRSNTSRHDVDADDHTDHRPSTRYGGYRRSNVVAPTFLRRLSSTQVLEGEELLLQCEVSGDPDPKLHWLRNGLEVGIDEDEVFISFRNGVARLRLRDVQSQHAGEYVCKAQNEGGVVQCSSRVTVKAKPIEIRPRFLRSLLDVRAVEGETLTLETEVEGIPTPEIVWSLDGEEITSGDSSFYNNLAKLVLHNVTTASSGQYMCNALNSSGEDSVACRVRIKQKKTDITPEFTAPLSDVASFEGDDVCLRCMVTGIPEPSVQWKFNDELLEAEDGTEITFHDGVAALTLEQATEEDTGRYTCVAINSEGRATTRCNVTVKAVAKPEKKSTPPSVPKFVTTFDEYIRTQDGDELVLECKISGSPDPEVTWTLNDKKVENGTATFQNGNAVMRISSMTSSHGGHIKCTASNYAGKASHEAKIYVRSKRVAPAFETHLPSSITIVEGEEAYFECKVTGQPQPRVSWTRDGRSLSVLSTETSYEDGVAAVRIRKAGPREAGKYICVARNLSGEAESVCVVSFHAKKEETHGHAPKFTKDLKDVTLSDGQDLQLECHVTGDPEPKVSWEVDGQKVESEDGDARYRNGVATLVLEDAMPEDSGEYRCIAVNSSGKSHSSCRVVVKAAEAVQPVKPRIREPSFPVVLEDKTVKEGKDIVLKCQVDGDPRPKITWLLDGEEIVDAEIKYSEDGDVELVLTEALPEDEGVYTCIAETPHKRVMCSCKVTIEVPPRVPQKKSSGAGLSKKEPEIKVQNDANDSASPPAATKPTFIKELEDRTVQDGSTSFVLSCRVTGNPATKWFLEQEEIEPSDDFQMVADGDVRKLIFAEVFPDDSGTYSCLVTNDAGEAKTSCVVSVEEIDGDAPSFLMKPKPMNVNAGEKAVFACRVDGDPKPSVQWMFCNRPIQDLDRIQITEGDASNDNTYSLEIPQVNAHDGGRYSVCCSNLLGDVTCTVSLIVNDAMKQEAQTDFRGVLKKKVVTSPSNKPTNEESVDFRSVLRRKSSDKDIGKRRTSSSGAEDASEDSGIAYTKVLSTSVKTKALTEEERKMKRAEQKDFRSNLVRKVDTKVVSQDAIRAKASEQLDFRDEALKTKVTTKSVGQDDLKTMHAEQKDFRAETIKSKVVTKAYKEELVKAKRAEQVDFRNVLSPTKKEKDNETVKNGDEGVVVAAVSKAKWKKEVDHTTVATKRSRHRGAASIVPERKVQQNGEEQEEEEAPTGFKPEFKKLLSDVETKDGEPFELVCHVKGDPRPQITWFLENEEIKAEADITIEHEGERCRLGIAESFPEDQGKYTCTASNEYGDTSCSCNVTVLGDGE